MMSVYRKGTRKSKGGLALRDINIGGLKVQPASAIAALMAALYAVFLLGSRLESGSDALILSLLSALIFVAFAYLVRSGSLAGLKPFSGLIDAFIALSALTLLWDLAAFLGLAGISGFAGPVKPALTGLVYAALTAVLIGGLLYYKKGKLMASTLDDIYVKACNFASIALGAAVLVVGLLLGIGVLYVISGSSALSANNLLPLLAGVLIFGVLGGASEELWFRGLLLSRLIPVVREEHANIIQASVYGVFEAVTIYAITSQFLYLPFIFIGGTFLGYYWGKVTIDDDSLLGAVLYHIGFLALIGIPMFSGLL